MLKNLTRNFTKKIQNSILKFNMFYSFCTVYTIEAKITIQKLKTNRTSQHVDENTIRCFSKLVKLAKNVE